MSSMVIGSFRDCDSGTSDLPTAGSFGGPERDCGLSPAGLQAAAITEVTPGDRRSEPVREIAHQEQDDQDYHDQAQAAAGGITPIAAVPPARPRAQEQKDDHNQKQKADSNSLQSVSMNPRRRASEQFA